MKINEHAKIKGTVRIDTYRAGMVKAVMPMIREIKQMRALGQTSYADALKNEIEEIKKQFHIRQECVCPNLVVDSPNYGIDLLIQWMVSNLLWAEFGTGTATPTLADTVLTTPIVRGPVTFQQDYGTTDAIIDFYFTDANLPNNTYAEVGAFANGTSTIGSGALFDHALLSPTYKKISGQDTTLQFDFNLANT